MTVRGCYINKKQFVMMRIKLGTSPVGVTYSDVELREKVIGLISAGPEGTGFRSICDSIMESAEKEGRLDTSTGEQYQWMELDRADILRIDRVIAQALNDGVIMVDYDTTHYTTDDTYFIKL